MTRKKGLHEAYAAWKGQESPVFHFAIVREDEDATNGGLDREGTSGNVAIYNNENGGTHTVGNYFIEAMLELEAGMEV